MIFISRHSQQLGRFSEEEVARGLQDGRFLSTDLGWKEGMEKWQPLSTFGLIEASKESPSAPIYAPGLPIGEPSAPQGLPWQRPGGIFSRWWETTYGALLAPVVTFREMKKSEEFGGPFLYLIVCFAVLYASSAFSQLLYQGIMTSLSSAPSSGETAASSAFSIIVYLLAGFIVIPLGAAITAFVGSALFHGCLFIFGGATGGYSVTYQVTCYVSGALNVLQVIPILGPLVAMLWGPVAYMIALKEAHQTETWRAICAVLLPYFLCCAVAVALVFAGVAFATAAFEKFGSGLIPSL